MAIVFRNTKGSALTHAELDGNFSDLNSRIRDSSAIVSLIETNSIDSAKANNLINATLVTTIDNRIATKSTDDLSEGASNLYFTNARAQAVSIDSAEAIQLIDSAYVQARQATADTGITVQEEGVSLSNAGTTLNFVGSSVTASGTGATKTITITDAAGIDSAAAIQAVTSDNLNMGSNNITTTGKILFANVYNDSSDLPNATTYHGMFAHVHNTGAGYFAHAGNWVRLANKSEVGIDSTATIDLIDSAYIQARESAGVPAGSDRQIQFNNSGSFGGDATFTFTKVSTASRVGVGIAAASNLYVPGPAGVSNSVLHIHNPTPGNAGSGVKMTRITSGSSDSAGLELFIAPSDEGYLYHNQNENIHIGTNRITRFTVSNSGGVQVTNRGDLRLGDSDNSHYVGFKAPSTVGTNYIWTLPSSDGSNGHFLKTDGSGNLSFAAGGGGGGTPGGSTTQVQFNDGGSFAGDAGLVYSKDSDKLTAVNLAVTNITATGSGSTTVTAGANIELNATNRVLVTDTPFRLASMTTTQRNAIASPVNGDMIYNSTIGQYEIYQRSAWHPLTKGSAIFNVVNNGASHYTYTDAETHWFPTSEDDPVLYLRRGETYYFIINASGHPFQIRTGSGGSAYNTGVSNNGTQGGTIVFKVPMSAPATLYYQCTIHSAMGNTINIV